MLSLKKNMLKKPMVLINSRISKKGERDGRI
jgi:hypothetical protein